jgi:DNA-binding NtrC family response regulator
MKETILVIDDEDVIRKALDKFLRGQGYHVLLASDGEKGLQLIQSENVDAVIVDLQMPKVSGMEVVKKIQETKPDVVRVVMTAHGTIPSAIEAIKSGAYHYLTKPFELDEIEELLHKAMDYRRLQRENSQLKKQLKDKYKFDNIVGESEAIMNVFQLVEKVANTDSTILITGESGTGKELVARAIHYNSGRSERPMITVNCAAIPENLLESELFGHVKGAFTGAVTTKAGRFEMAHGGSIFLDEIGDMSLKLQVKLLRVLQERKFEPVGATRPKEVDVRIITATNRDLEKMVAEGHFREDLYYRLHVIPIHLPALRDRLSDLPRLLDHFIRKGNKSHQKNVTGFSQEAMKVCEQHEWPGNVRELENLVERLVILKGQGSVTIDDLPPHLNEEKSRDLFGAVAIPDQGISFKSVVAQFESELILKALTKTKWNKNKAASLLNLNRTTLVEKIKKKQLDKNLLD